MKTVIEYLKAQVIIERTRAQVLRQWSLNTDFNLQASACEKVADKLTQQILELQSQSRKK